MTKMTTEEAFVKVLQTHGIEHAFGIIGSAFMPISDLFPKAGITFWDVAHETNGGLIADGYTRSTGKMSMVIAQNGPGITNMVTGIASAYWAHSPVVMISPQSSTAAEGHGTFQECEQMSLFSKITKYQVNVSNPSRMMELVNNGFKYAKLYNGPSQVNIPRDMFFNEYDFTYPQSATIATRTLADIPHMNRLIKLIRESNNPMIISGGGAVISNATDKIAKLASYIGAPVATTYLHNDAFNVQNPFYLGPLGYNGSKAAM